MLQSHIMLFYITICSRNETYCLCLKVINAFYFQTVEPDCLLPPASFPLSPFPRWDVGMKKWDFWLISIILLLFIISLPLLGINISLCAKQFDMKGDAKCQIMTS